MVFEFFEPVRAKLGPSQGFKTAPMGPTKNHVKMYHFECQIPKFSSIGPIGQKFDVFAKMAFKSTALWPLKVMDAFFGPLLVLLQVW